MKSIPRRLTHCALGEEIFTPGDEYVSFVDFDGNRHDYCLECWQNLKLQKKGHFWKGKVPEKRKKLITADEKALEIFREQKDPKYRWILALYLQRKQQLVRRTSTLYELPETGEVFDVPPLSLSSREDLMLAENIDQMIEAPTQTHE